MVKILHGYDTEIRGSCLLSRVILGDPLQELFQAKQGFQ